ncbi:MAG: hypothetical protein V1838_01080 [Patescibacteria group bacterium]
MKPLFSIKDSVAQTSIITLIVLVGLLINGPVQAAWSEPTTDAPPGGTMASPINISGTAQTKAGSLIIDPGLLVVGTTGSSYFCLNGTDINDKSVCISAWSEIGGEGKYVRLNPPSADPDNGYVRVVNTDIATTENYAIYGEAPAAYTSYTAGVFGYGTYGYFGQSYGVYGLGLGDYGIGIYGESGVASSYAGYYSGRVRIEGPLSVEYGNVSLEAGDALIGNNDNPGQICLYGTGSQDCIDDWGDVVAHLGSELWTEDPANNTYLTELDSNLAIGGTGYEPAGGYQTEFFFNVGDGGKFALGIPPAGSTITFTCGDGACNYTGEDNISCPQDCPASIPEVPIPGNVKSLTAEAYAGGIALKWLYPANESLGGAIAVRSVGAQPNTRPTDYSIPPNCTTYLGNGQVIANITNLSQPLFDDTGACIGSLSSGTEYFYRIFTYNTSFKFADGATNGANASATAQ